MKFNFNKQLLDLDGNPGIAADGKEVNIGKELSRIMSQESHEKSGLNPLDVWGYCLKINKGEDVDLEKGTQDLMLKWVETHPLMFANMKAQIIEILNAKPSKK